MAMPNIHTMGMDQPTSSVTDLKLLGGETSFRHVEHDRAVPPVAVYPYPPVRGWWRSADGVGAGAQGAGA